MSVKKRPAVKSQLNWSMWEAAKHYNRDRAWMRIIFLDKTFGYNIQRQV